MRRALLVLILCASPAAAILPTSTATPVYTATTSPTATTTATNSQTPTRTQTPTITATGTVTQTTTATGTVTATPTAYVIYNRDGRAPAIPVPIPTNWCVKVLDGENVGVSGSGCTSGGGGGNLTSSGATFDPAVCLDNEITTVNGDPSVNSASNLPAGSIANSCVTRINATLSGGVSIGLAGAADFWGTSGGTVGDSNRLDATLPSPARVLTAEPVVVTSTHSSGLFQNSTGKVRVVCFCDEIGAPTE